MLSTVKLSGYIAIKSYVMDWNDRQYIAPISCPPFTYSTDGGLKVNGHSRCDEQRLYELLTYVDPGPVLTKKGEPRVRQPPAHKDQTGAFYEAQLVHYGLKPLKTKSAAKRALLLEFDCNEGKLNVPEAFRELEDELAAQFRRENSEARKEYRAEMERKRQAEELRRKKRKREEDKVIAEFSKITSKKPKRDTVSKLYQTHPLANTPFTLQAEINSSISEGTLGLLYNSRTYAFQPMVTYRLTDPPTCAIVQRRTPVGLIRLRRFRRQAAL